MSCSFVLGYRFCVVYGFPGSLWFWVLCFWGCFWGAWVCWWAIFCFLAFVGGFVLWGWLFFGLIFFIWLMWYYWRLVFVAGVYVSVIGFLFAGCAVWCGGCVVV